MCIRDRWVNAIAGSAAIDADNMVKGTVYYDGITAVKSGKTAAEVKKAAALDKAKQ